jgi:hypothetical protein
VKRIFAIPETVICASLLIAGIYLLSDGISTNSQTAAELLIFGALLIVFGVVTLQAVLRSIVWHRIMLRRSAHYWSDTQQNAEAHEPGKRP